MRWFLALVMLILLHVDGKSQCDSLLQAASSAGGFRVAYLAQNGVDTLYQSADEWAPKYAFNYEADSSYSTWMFGEFLLNRRKLMLGEWCMKRVVNYDSGTTVAVANWTAAEMRQRSVTRPFLAYSGDTLQFYRTISWLDKATMALSYDFYVNQNGISYSVELVSSASGSRIALLDTCSFATTTATRKPSLYSWYPMASRVRYVLPITFDSTNVFIRVNTWTSGASPHPFTRYDGLGPMRSAIELSSSQWRSYSDSVQANIVQAGSVTCSITVGTTSNPLGMLVGHGQVSGLDRLSVVDIYGATHWTSACPLLTNPTHVALGQGLYIVVGNSGGQVICTKSIIIQ